MSLNSLITTKMVPSLISKGVSIEGNIHDGGILELEGKIKGNVEADTLTIRETGEIIGEIRCKVFNVKGTFNGTVIAEKINISDTAKILGNLEYKFLSADYGASINCQLKRTEDSKQSILKNFNLIGNTTPVEQIPPAKNGKNTNNDITNVNSK
jgi:cytoskeletal protein CcmA (bactofilin family)